MPRILIFFFYRKVLLIFSFISLLFIKCDDNSIQKVSAPNNFVTIKNNSFFLNNKSYYPLTLNYIAELRYDNNKFWISSSIDYSNKKSRIYTEKDSSILEFKSHMQLIKDMGMNSIRLVRIGEVNIDSKTNQVFINARTKSKKDTTLVLSKSSKNYSLYLNALEESFKIIDSVGLKIVFLMNLYPDYKESVSHFIKVAGKFKYNSTIMAYDFKNEPLYFDKEKRTKKEVFKCVNNWQRKFRKFAPFHLSTIGLQGIREVFEWDPNILNVDFISYHPYEHEREQVRNEIYWYSKHTNKPWVIGETGWYSSILNESDSLSSQKMFINKTLQQAFDCNAIGYSWWQFKDVSWNDFKNHSDLMGLVTKSGIINSSTSDFPIVGTVKESVEVFKNFNPIKEKSNCKCLTNYYNYSNSDKFSLTGKLLDDNGTPIEGGVILAWNKYWTNSYHTITKKDGSFQLLGSFPFYHWMASATRYNMIRADINPLKSKVNVENIPSIKLGNLIIEPLSFLD